MRRSQVLEEIHKMVLERNEVVVDEVVRKYNIAYNTALNWMREVAARFGDVVYERGVLRKKEKKVE